MKDLKEFVRIDENGKLVIDQEAFNQELDRERNLASETSSKNTEKKLRSAIEKEVIEKIQNEAKMTAEEKVKAERELLEKERLEFNKERVKNIYKASGLFADEEIELYGDLISNDYEKSVEKANSLVEIRKKRNLDYEKTITEKMQSQQPRTNGGNGSTTESEGAKRAKLGNSNSNNSIVEL